MVLWQISLRAVVIGLLIGWCVDGSRCAEPGEPHVLFSFDRQQAGAEHHAADAAVTEQVNPSPPPTAAHAPPALPKVDPQVVVTSHVDAELAEPPVDRRRLAPLSPTDRLSRTTAENKPSKLPFDIPHVDSLGTAGAGLVLVVGLFLLCVSLVRRGGHNPTAPLPHDAVSVLGRIPLTPKVYAQLIHVGNKLVLVAISGDRIDTITEIAEPAEVERLLVQCVKSSKQSSSAEFQKLLAQMAKEPARGFLGRETTTFSRTRG